MLPIYQDIFGHEEGNCFPSCLASILEIPLAAVPNFYAYNNLNAEKEINDFLYKYNLKLIEFYRNCVDIIKTFKNTHLIVTGEIEGCNYLHSVIYFNNKMIHDPIPNGTGLNKIESVGVLLSTITLRPI